LFFAHHGRGPPVTPAVRLLAELLLVHPQFYAGGSFFFCQHGHADSVKSL
jgi:hypothetical protein